MLSVTLYEKYLCSRRRKYPLIFSIIVSYDFICGTDLCQRAKALQFEFLGTCTTWIRWVLNDISMGRKGGIWLSFKPLLVRKWLNWLRSAIPKRRSPLHGLEKGAFDSHLFSFFFKSTTQSSKLNRVIHLFKLLLPILAKRMAFTFSSIKFSQSKFTLAVTESSISTASTSQLYTGKMVGSNA